MNENRRAIYGDVTANPKRQLWWCPRRNYRTRHSGPRSGNILLPEALAKLVIVMSLALNSPLIGPVTMPSKPQLGAVSSAISRPTPLSFSTTTYEPSCWSLSKVAITVSTLGISCPGLTMNRRGFDRTS